LARIRVRWCRYEGNSRVREAQEGLLGPHSGSPAQNTLVAPQHGFRPLALVMAIAPRPHRCAMVMYETIVGCVYQGIAPQGLKSVRDSTPPWSCGGQPSASEDSAAECAPQASSKDRGPSPG
jgi:hypothetical protein